MTENAIRYQEAKEKERHNRAEEKRNESVAKVQKAATTIGSLMDTFGTIGKSAAVLANDPKWYSRNPVLVKDSARISFNTPLGNEVQDTFSSRIMPGLMTLEYIPTIGDTDTANAAAKNIYAFIRHANSGSKNYEPNDIMAYLYTMSDAFSLHGWLARIYSLALDAKGENKYYFDATLIANHVDPADIRSNLAQLRALINSYAIRINAFAVPKDLSLFNRRYWMATGIFKDSAIKKSQEYMFVPRGWMTYNDATSVLEFNRIESWTSNASGLLDYSDIVKLVNTVLNTILGSTDIGIMSGDILKAYGSNLYKLGTIDDNFHIESLYSPEVLSQIHNATIVSDGDNSAVPMKEIYSIRCPAGGKICQGIAGVANYADGTLPIDIYYGGGSAPINNSSKVINMYKDDVTPDELMVATRLTALNGDHMPLKYIHASGDTLYVVNDSTAYTSTGTLCFAGVVGTEVIARAIIYYFDSTYTVQTNEVKSSLQCIPTNKTYNTLTSNEWNRIKSAYAQMILLSKFDWAPTVYYYQGGYATTATYLQNEFDNLDAANTATVSANTLKSMHYTAVISELGIPQM